MRGAEPRTTRPWRRSLHVAHPPLGVPGALVGHWLVRDRSHSSNSLIIIARSCWADRRPSRDAGEGKDGSWTVAMRSGDLRGLPDEAGEVADRDTVRSLLGEPCVIS